MGYGCGWAWILDEAKWMVEIAVAQRILSIKRLIVSSYRIMGTNHWIQDETRNTTTNLFRRWIYRRYCWFVFWYTAAGRGTFHKFYAAWFWENPVHADLHCRKAPTNEGQTSDLKAERRRTMINILQITTIGNSQNEMKDPVIAYFKRKSSFVP